MTLAWRRRTRKPKRYRLTNDIFLTGKKIKEHYAHRQQIKAMFRLLKQEFGWVKCRAGTKKAQTAHLHPGLYALYLVQMKGNKTAYQFKQKLSREAIPTQNQFVKVFTTSA